jgi:hypothetical protein
MEWKEVAVDNRAPWTLHRELWSDDRKFLGSIARQARNNQWSLCILCGDYYTQEVLPLCDEATAKEAALAMYVGNRMN